MTTIYVNGEVRELDTEGTIADVVRTFAMRAGVAVARNGEVVPRSEWASTALEGDDRIEVLSVAPGG